MPYQTTVSSRNSGSSAILSNLGTFGFQSKPKFQTPFKPVANSYDNLISIDLTESNRESSSSDSIIEIDVLDSPKSQVTITPVITSDDCNRSTSSSYKQKPLSSSYSNRKSQSPEMECIVSDESEVEPSNDYGILCDKEHCLRKLLAICPNADIMEAQDVLVSCGWNLQLAIQKVKSSINTNAESPNRKNRTSAKSSKSEHLISVQNISSSSAPSQSLPVDEIVLDSGNDTDNSLGISVAKTEKKSNITEDTLSNGIHYGSNSANSCTASNIPIIQPVSSTFESNMKVKKRKRVQCLDDDDSDNSNSLSSTARFYSPAPSSTNSVTTNQAQEFSVLDFKPAASSLPSSSLKNYTYSKNPTHNPPSYERTVDSSIFEVEESPTLVVSPRKKRNFIDRYSVARQKATSKSHIKSHSKKKRTKIEVDDDDDDEDYGNDIVYDSDDSNCGETLTPGMNKVLTFFQDASTEELTTIPNCSKKKAEVIVKYRPFVSWTDLVAKLNGEKCLSTDLLNGAKKVLDMRAAVTKLMKKCRKIALQMEDLVEALKENKEDSKDYVSVQPKLLNSEMQLTSYQMLGLNWLLLMHNQEVNGILADEMGLGKTIQAIAFLSYLKEQNLPGPHLIVVPSSTLDNWLNELEIWWPSASVLCYHGSQENRRELRMQIINDEIDEFDVMVSTYNMVTSSTEDRGFFKRLEFYYVIFDEAHMLKNMASQRYQNLMRVRATRRLLLTGTPLQNNLVELMSLLIFAMPHMFSGKTEQIKLMFSAVCKKEESRTHFEKDRIEHAKRIMKPFVLRRLKSEVLQDLPAKHEEIRHCSLSEAQNELYVKTVHDLYEQVQANKEKDLRNSGAGMMMQLRKAANHPLLLRKRFSDDKLLKMSKLMLNEPTHCESNPDLIFEDMCVMSDFELHRLCKQYLSLKEFILSTDIILDSGKFIVLNELLPSFIEKGHRILLFSQFTMVLDVVEEYMKIRKYKYLRLDGQIPVSERQALIDDFNQCPDILIFLLSTRAGGLGINLTSADTVIIHDIDFNPYNDKQAEDRCHRVGQQKDVHVIRLISKDTIEEGILKRAQDKLKLERDVTTNDSDEEQDSVSVAALLRDALGICDKS